MSHKLSENPIHLGLGATAVVQPPFTGMQWYEDYGARNAADGREGRLVSMHTFDSDWGVWEMHPVGHEVVVCIAGVITLVQKRDLDSDEEVVVTLQPGEYAINEPGVYHTAKVDAPCTALFITAGEGTENIPM